MIWYEVICLLHGAVIAPIGDGYCKGSWVVRTVPYSDLSHRVMANLLWKCPTTTSPTLTVINNNAIVCDLCCCVHLHSQKFLSEIFFFSLSFSFPQSACTSLDMYIMLFVYVQLSEIIYLTETIKYLPIVVVLKMTTKPIE